MSLLPEHDDMRLVALLAVIICATIAVCIISGQWASAFETRAYIAAGYMQESQEPYPNHDLKWVKPGEKR